MEKFEIKNNPEKILQSLADDISWKYWIEKEKAISLIRQESIKTIEDLKQELKKENLDRTELDKLFLEIQKIKNILNRFSEVEISKLKSQIEIASLKEKIDIDTFQNSLEWKLPRKLLKIAKNPEKPHEHLVWVSLWIANSTIAIWESIVKIWIWIIKSPYDLYLLISWKAEIESLKKI